MITASDRELTSFSVYSLRDELLSKVFYVGIAEDTVQRYTQHIKLTGSNHTKNFWVKRSLDRGTFPVMDIHMRCQGKQQVLEMEALFIELFRIFKQPLTNRGLKLCEHGLKGKAFLSWASDTVNTIWPLSSKQEVLFDAETIQILHDAVRYFFVNDVSGDELTYKVLALISMCH